MILQMIYPLLKPAIWAASPDRTSTHRRSPATWPIDRVASRFRTGLFQSHVAVIARVVAVITIFSLGTGLTVHADGLPEPTGEILLTISGNISSTNHEDGAVFDLEMLESMESITVETKTPWTEGVTRFTGVLLEQLLMSVGAESRMLKMSAEDGYIYEPLKPVDDEYPIIVAYKKDDEYMSLRQLGPLWVMYPFDDYPELDTEENRAACVWQLKLMEVK